MDQGELLLRRPGLLRAHTHEIKIQKQIELTSKTQKQISNLLNDYDNHVEEIRGNYLEICKTKINLKDDYNMKILQYPNYKNVIKKNMIEENAMFKFLTSIRKTTSKSVIRASTLPIIFARFPNFKPVVNRQPGFRGGDS